MNITIKDDDESIVIENATSDDLKELDVDSGGSGCGCVGCALPLLGMVTFIWILFNLRTIWEILDNLAKKLL